MKGISLSPSPLVLVFLACAPSWVVEKIPPQVAPGMLLAPARATPSCVLRVVVPPTCCLPSWELRRAVTLNTKGGANRMKKIHSPFGNQLLASASSAVFSVASELDRRRSR
jgi:hypothetical protein